MNLESNVYERVNEIVDELRFRSFDKVYATIKNELPNVRKKEVRKVLMMRNFFLPHRSASGPYKSPIA